MSVVEISNLVLLEVTLSLLLFMVSLYFVLNIQDYLEGKKKHEKKSNYENNKQKGKNKFIWKF